jgi:hypothetical protein
MGKFREKKLSAYSFPETFCEEYSVFKTVAFESAVSSKTSIEQLSFRK